jgi:hypothetical protein
MSAILLIHRNGGKLLRKLLTLILAAVMLCTVLLCSSASANSWNLKGKLLQAMIKTHDWDDYILLGNQADPFAVMSARYHNALFFVDDQTTSMFIQQRYISLKQRKKRHPLCCMGIRCI